MYAHFETFSIEMTKQQALGASGAGACDDAIAALAKNKKIKKQLDALPIYSVATELRQYGAWEDEELSDTEQNKLRILWCAACNIKEDIKSNS